MIRRRRPGEWQRIAIRTILGMLSRALSKLPQRPLRELVQAGTPGSALEGALGSRRLTTDPDDPRLTHGVDDKPVEQADAYLVSEPGPLVRPLRTTYRHTDGCDQVTTMGLELARTWASDPSFYGATYCAVCRMHRPVEEFTWYGTDERLGT